MLDLRTKAICEIFTGLCFCVGEERKAVYEYAAELMGRPVFTHELAVLADELKERAREDFIALCQPAEDEEQGGTKMDKAREAIEDLIVFLCERYKEKIEDEEYVREITALYSLINQPVIYPALPTNEEV